MARLWATDLDRSQCRFGQHLRASLLIRVNLRLHFLATHRQGWRRNAKSRNGAVKTPWGTSDRSELLFSDLPPAVQLFVDRGRRVRPQTTTGSVDAPWEVNGSRLTG